MGPWCHLAGPPEGQPARIDSVHAMGTIDYQVHEGLSGKADFDDAAVVAARAFQTDPFFEHLAPPSMLRARGLALYMRAALKNVGPKGRILTVRTNDRIAGVALWVAPGGYPAPARNQAAQMAGMVHAFAPRPQMTPNALRYVRAIEKAHPHEAMWYLQVLATDPEHQRRGVGASLLGPVLEDCDEQGLPAYLETQKFDNLAYYRRHGFGLEQTLEPVVGAPPLWTMIRQPRSRASTTAS